MSVVTASSSVLDAGSSPAISTKTTIQAGPSVRRLAFFYARTGLFCFDIAPISPILLIWLKIYLTSCLSRECFFAPLHRASLSWRAG
jgi:hypothetical protein